MSKIDRIEDYLHFKRVNNLHNSDNTTRSYRNHLTQWHEFAQGKFKFHIGQIPDERNIDGSILEAVATEYRDRIVKTRDSGQVKTIMHILRDYISFLGCDLNPFDKLVKDFKINVKEHYEKKARRDELALTEFEIESFIKHAEKETYLKKDDEYYMSHRNWLMIKMLASYGMRIKALVSIKLEDIDFKRRLIIIRSSKNKIPYPLPIIKMINDIRYHISVVRKEFSQCDDYEGGSLFLSKSGKQISATSARRAINKIADIAGLYEPQRSTHQIRHFRATQYIKDGMEIDLVSQIMGVSVQVLRKTYLHMTHDDTISQYESWLNHSRIEPVCPKCGFDQRRKTETKLKVMEV